MSNSLDLESDLESTDVENVDTPTTSSNIETGANVESGTEEQQDPVTDTKGKSDEESPSKEPKSQAKVENKENDKAGVYNPEISTNKAKDIKETITLSEKADVTSILMGKLSLSDLKVFQKLASGGMTVDEKREARKLLLDKLTPSEYNKLSKIAKKYGVSQGKTYDQAEEEEANSSN